MMDLFLVTMIGFAFKTKQPCKRGGLFGVVKAFICEIESQTKTTLHVHLIVYLAGFPRTCQAFDQFCESEDLKGRLERFADSITSHTAPIDGQSRPCSSCDDKRCIETVGFPSRAYLALHRYTLPPPTVCGKTCGQFFGSDDILRTAVTEIHERSYRLGYKDLIPLGSTGKESDMLTEHHMSLPNIPCIHMEHSHKPSSLTFEKTFTFT